MFHVKGGEKRKDNLSVLLFRAQSYASGEAWRESDEEVEKNKLVLLERGTRRDSSANVMPSVSFLSFRRI